MIKLINGTVKSDVPLEWVIQWRETQAVTVRVAETMLGDISYLFLTGRTVPSQPDVGLTLVQFPRRTRENLKALSTRSCHDRGMRVLGNRHHLGPQPVNGQATDKSSVDATAVFGRRHKGSGKRPLGPGNPALAIRNE